MAYRNKNYILARKRFLDTLKSDIEVEITYGGVKMERRLNVGGIV